MVDQKAPKAPWDSDFFHATEGSSEPCADEIQDDARPAPPAPAAPRRALERGSGRAPVEVLPKELTQRANGKKGGRPAGLPLLRRFISKLSIKESITFIEDLRDDKLKDADKSPAPLSLRFEAAKFLVQRGLPAPPPLLPDTGDGRSRVLTVIVGQDDPPV